MSINVAIDGPAGAGKSTISRRAAKELGFIYVDTGALYRTVGLNAIRTGVNLDSPEEIAESVKGISVDLGYENGEQSVFLNGENVSAFIRTPEASMAASRVSAVPAVREFLFGLQQDIAAKNDCVMDGRDIGTVVLPHAQVKIFLTASAEERARRRYKELMEKGEKVEYEKVLAEMKERDYNDSNRAIAPLKAAPDAITVDTTELTLEESIEKTADPAYATAVGILLKGAEQGACAFVERPAARPAEQQGFRPPQPQPAPEFRHTPRFQQPVQAPPAAPAAEEAEEDAAASGGEETPVIESKRKRNWSSIFQKTFDKINSSFTAAEDEEI